jgi:hypothetical protein
LKALHDQKRNDGSRQPNSNTGHSNFVDDRRKTILLALAKSFGNEVRKVQRFTNFDLTPAN